MYVHGYCTSYLDLGNSGFGLELTIIMKRLQRINANGFTNASRINDNMQKLKSLKIKLPSIGTIKEGKEC